MGTKKEKIYFLLQFLLQKKKKNENRCKRMKMGGVYYSPKIGVLKENEKI